MADDDDGEYTAEAEALESFSLTMPHVSGPRHGPVRGMVVRTWLLPPAAAQAFEESLKRHNSQVRTKLRIYRGTRELQPEIGDEDDLPSVTPPPSRESAPPDAMARELEKHLAALNRSIELAQQRLERIETEVSSARERRDRELAANLQLVELTQSSTLRQIEQSRNHAIDEQRKAFLLDRQAGDQFATSWSQVTDTATVVSEVRGILGKSVLADRMEKYLTIGKEVVTGVADSEVGRVIGLQLASKMALLVNKVAGSAEVNPATGKPFTAEDVLLAALLRASMFAERRRLLGQYAVLAPGAVGQGLLLGVDFCLGSVAPEAIEELVNAATQRAAAVAVAA